MLSEAGHWCLLIGTHLVRFVLEDFGQHSLREEVAGLRVEVHRARTLVSDYNSVLGACESELRWIKLASKLFTLGNVFLGLILIGAWILYQGRRLSGNPRQAIGDSGDLEPVVRDTPQVTVIRSGPRRPSDFDRVRA